MDNNAVLIGVPLLLLAQAAAPSSAPVTASGPVPAPTPPVAAKPAGKDCAQQPASKNPNEIVVCAVKPNGYRIDPDLMAARKAKKEIQTGRPRNPHETFADRSCANVGPMGCRGGPAVDLLAVAMTAAQISERLAKGQEIGSIFKTDPTPSEYQLYQEARKQREDKEAQAAADKVKAAAQAAPAQQPAAK